jgi:hypothetical protein
VSGVIEMVNKVAGTEPFTKWDSQVSKIFSVFSGIAIENARAYHQLVGLRNRQHRYFHMSLATSSADTVLRMISEMIHNARETMHAECAAMFLVDNEAGLLASLITDGGKLPPTIPMASEIAIHCVRRKEVLVVSNAFSDPRFTKNMDLASTVLMRSVCIMPILSSENDAIGVLQIVNKADDVGPFTEQDIQLMKAIASFVSIAFANPQLRELSSTRSGVAEIEKYIPEEERGRITVPRKLVLAADKQREVSAITFRVHNWGGTQAFKLLFFIFNKFHLLETFHITSELFFNYVFQLRSKYNDVPYHNWAHIIDMMQFLAYSLSMADMSNVLGPLELFSLLIAATAHDLGHDGFATAHNVKADIPLSILLKTQSAEETSHCMGLIALITQDDCNLLSSLREDDVISAWKVMIPLMLAMDMANHFSLLSQFTEMVFGPGIDTRDPEDRLLVMQMFLKTADVSGAARPFDDAAKWADSIFEEAAHYHETANQTGKLFLNPRLKFGKEKLLIAFYDFVCVPLYAAMARAYPPLEVNLNAVTRNLDVWKTHAQPAPEEE